MALPQYYSSLGPFRAIFLTGRPVLAYHHVGGLSRGARIRGLYVSPKLFARQMEELTMAGFATTGFQFMVASRKLKGPHVFLTFDDGYRDVFENALPVLQAQRSCSIQFLVSDLIGKTNEWQQRAGDVIQPLMDEHQVRDWLAAGQQIGSHTRSHPFLTRLSSVEAREELTGSKKQLEDRFGLAIEHFCYPYGDWNQGVRDLVQEAGYTTACTTQFGFNDKVTDPFAIERITARYPSRTWKNFFNWLSHYVRAAAQT